MSQQEREALVLGCMRNPTCPIETWCKENGMSLSSHYRARKALEKKGAGISSEEGVVMDLKAEKETGTGTSALKAGAGWAMIGTARTGDANNTEGEETRQG